MSLSGEEQRAPMSLSGEEQRAPMSHSGDKPKVSRARAAVLVAVGLAVAGALVGALWAWLAPPSHGVVALTRSGNRVHTYLGSEADHFFVAAFMMLGFLSVLAVVAAVLVWQWRPHRGPVLAAALSLGSVAAAAAATGVGAALAHWRYGTVDIAGAPVSPQNRVHYFTEAPTVFFGHTPLQIASTLVVPAAIGALVYALLAVSTARDDLGGWPAFEPLPRALPPSAVVTPSDLPAS